MSRGLLSDEELRQIEQQLPDTPQVATLVINGPGKVESETWGRDPLASNASN